MIYYTDFIELIYKTTLMRLCFLIVSASPFLD